MDGPQVSHHASVVRSDSLDARERSDSLDHTTWDAADGIDKLMVSVSKSSTPVTPAAAAPSPIATAPPAAAPETVFRVAPPAKTPTPPPAIVDAEPVKPSATMPAPDASSAPLLVTLGAGSGAGTAPKPATKFGAKKPVTKKKIGAKKLSGDNDIRMESFEKVEKRSAKAAQEAADFDAAVALDRVVNEGSGVSRVGAVYEESNAPAVTVASKQVQKGSIYTQDPASSSSRNAGGYSSSPKSLSYTAPPTYAATDSRFSSKKGISSDQYFGRDQEDEQEMRGKLNKYGGATAISSDMLYHDEAAPDFGTVSYSEAMAARARAGSGEFGKLKDSVKNFFDDVTRNIG